MEDGTANREEPYAPPSRQNDNRRKLETAQTFDVAMT